VTLIFLHDKIAETKMEEKMRFTGVEKNEVQE
jgi:hypothetical protein